jgi:ankyrin repeat protein
LPHDLEDTYERVLASIGDEYAEDVRRVLTVLCFSTRPLTVNELIDAHAVDLSQPPSLDRDGRGYEQDDLIDICLGLVDTTKAQDEFGEIKTHVHIAHFSVKEYLLSKRIQQGKMKKFAIQGGPANTEIAQICIVYLLDPILSLGRLDQAKLKAFPLARYAAQYWHHHFQNAQEKAALTEELLQRLFCIDIDCFATSVKLYDLDATCFPDEWYDMLMEADSCPRVDFGWRLYYASLLGLESVVRSMITRIHNDGVRQDVVNVQYGHCGTSLQAASFGGYDKVVEMLLDRGADINTRGGFYGNAFQAASYSGNVQVVQILLRRGADVYMQGGYYGNSLQAASHAGHIELVKMLLDRGTDVNLQGGKYRSALLAASQAGHEDVVQLLLSQSAEINTAEGEYGNALQAAIIGRHEKVVQMLLDHGADVNIQGGWYGNALQAASFYGHEKIVQDLIDRRAVVSGRGALSAALLQGKDRVALILLANGADINNDGEVLPFTLPLLSACFMVR